MGSRRPRRKPLPTAERVIAFLAPREDAVDWVEITAIAQWFGVSARRLAALLEKLVRQGRLEVQRPGRGIQGPPRRFRVARSGSESPRSPGGDFSTSPEG